MDVCFFDVFYFYKNLSHFFFKKVATEARINISLHIVWQTNTVFTCYKCEKCFSSSMALSQHQACHSREEKPFSCAYCQKNLSTYTEVRAKHALCKHLLFLEKLSTRQFSIVSQLRMIHVLQLNHHKRYECIERRYPCRDCGALFPSAPRLRNHRIAVHPDCLAVVSEIRTYQCCKCCQAFQTEDKLLRHEENFASDLNCEVKQLGKKRGHRPKTAAHSNVADAKKSKKEEVVEECKEHCEFKTEG